MTDLSMSRHGLGKREERSKEDREWSGELGRFWRWRWVYPTLCLSEGEICRSRYSSPGLK
ncbi:hypothetical protein BKA56DRAFT_606510 [Ilyonectria sp. MPI-CAGE-AT-0026]|nr:hypothetical protein BKA56DRAFT_606510 [Ilyonectria sp. MPI-CAGE-AT-0026]